MKCKTSSIYRNLSITRTPQKVQNKSIMEQMSANAFDSDFRATVEPDVPIHYAAKEFGQPLQAVIR